MEKEILDKYIRAGKIASEARVYGKPLIKIGASLLEVSDKIEKKILGLGGKLAFPVQISMNDVAAHNCAEPDDKTKFKKGAAPTWALSVRRRCASSAGSSRRNSFHRSR